MNQIIVIASELSIITRHNKYENIPNLCDKFKVKKNLINPIYIS